MSKSDQTPHKSDGPNQEPVSPRDRGPWPFQRDDGYENPSLERYTDLRFGEEKRGHRPWVVTLAAILALCAIIVLGFMVAIYAEAHGDETRQVDAIIVLGTTQNYGSPGRHLESRLQHANDLYQAGYAEWIIVTGGRVPGDPFTEAGVSRDWLVERGVPEEAILYEDEGRNTWENMTGAWTAAEPHGIKSVLIVSDGFHLFRAERMAQAVGFDAYTSPTPYSPVHPWSVGEFTFVIRETVAVIVQIPRWLF